MAPNEINRRLVLAIGYSPEDLFFSSGAIVYIWRESPVSCVKTWLVFDHRDWHTIGPIMERYKFVPRWREDTRDWMIYQPRWQGGGVVIVDDCFSTCAALAVIEAHERGLL